MRAYVVSLIVTAAAVFTASCDAFEPAQFEPEVIVESYQVAGELLQPVYLSWTAPFEGVYVFEERTLQGAEVRVQMLAEDGTVEESYRFWEHGSAAGVYMPDTEAVVQPLRTYVLEVVVPGREQPVRARTLVPGAFDLVGVSADTIVYRRPPQLELTLMPSRSSDRESVFVFTTESLEPLSEHLTPLAWHLVSGSEGELSTEGLRISSSQPLHEDNLRYNEDGTMTARYPWVAILFYGLNQVTVSAVDRNMDAFIRSQAVQRGGTTLSPGEIPNVLEFVEGGTGIFGSLARHSVEIYVRPPGGQHR